MPRWKTLWLISLLLSLVACRSEPQPLTGDWSETLPNDWLAMQAIIVQDTLNFSNWGYTLHDSPETPIIAVFNLTSKQLLWQVEREVLVPMDSDGERLFLVSQNGIQALSLKDGSTLWRVDLGSIGSNDYYQDDELLSRDGRVFFSDQRGDDSVLYALDAQNGSMIWSRKLDAPLDFFRRAPLPDYWDDYRAVNYDRGRLYVREYLRDGIDEERFHFLLVALDATDGRKLWEFPFDNPATHGDEPPGGSSRPAVSDHAVIIGTYGGVTYALDRETDRLLWRRELDLSLPIYAGGQVLGITFPFALSAIDPASGQVKWSLEEEGLYVIDLMHLSNDRLLVYFDNCDDRRLGVADIRKGAWLAVMRPHLPDNCMDSARALGTDGESIYLATLNCVHRFRAPW